MDDDVGLAARFKLEGEIELKLANGATVAITKAEARFAGHFGAPEEPFRLTLEGKMGELRKIGAVNASFWDLLRVAAKEPDDADGTVTFRPNDRKLRALQEAAKGMPELDAHALLENQAWMTQLFTFDGFQAESVGTVKRWREPL